MTSQDKTDIKLTQSGVDVSIYDPESNDFLNTIRYLVTKPDIYKRLYNDFSGSIPSDSSLKITLIKKYGFNPGKVGKFLKTFRRTIKFAGLSDYEDQANEHENVHDEEIQDHGFMKGQTLPITQTTTTTTSTGTRSPQVRSQSGLERSFVLRLKNENQVTISFFDMPVEKSDLDRIKKYIELQEDVWTESLTTEFSDEEED